MPNREGPGQGDDSGSRLISEAEAAALVKGACSLRTFRRLRQRGEGPPHFKVGALIRYRPEDVLAWLQSRRVAA